MLSLDFFLIILNILDLILQLSSYILIYLFSFMVAQ